LPPSYALQPPAPKPPAQNPPEPEPHNRPIAAIEAVYLVPVNAATGTISDACCDPSLLS